MQDTHISLAHGNGGRFMRELIDDIFARHLSNPDLDVQADAVPLAVGDGELMFTTDGFTVQPLEFPAGISAPWPYTAPPMTWPLPALCRNT